MIFFIIFLEKIIKFTDEKIFDLIKKKKEIYLIYQIYEPFLIIKIIFIIGLIIFFVVDR